MCGIWTYYQTARAGVRARAEARARARPEEEKDPYPVEAQWADARELAPRGPDYTRVEHIPSAGLTLVFHRLAIVDTSFEGIQPFRKECHDGRTLLFLCNGEIYNYKELVEREESPRNDCRVLFDLFCRMEQEEFVSFLQEQVKGEFAFVIWELDALQRVVRCVAGRDMIGVRPLYVSTGASVSEGKGLLFSSELKGALRYPGDMREFPPGHLYFYQMDGLGGMTVEDRILTRPLYAAGIEDQHPDECEEVLTPLYLSSVREAVVSSVKRRLGSDRPLAFLLSGGVDSSLVAAVSARLLGKPLRTFCCGLTEDGKKVGRDLEYAREVAEWLGSEHTEVLFTKEEALEVIPDVIRTVESWDTTTVRASVGQYLVCRWIGQNTDCRVVLVGEGPDEVCSSYLFNWYAPSGEALDASAREYVRRIHLYDARRADRCVARWGLEARVPFLDPEFVSAYWQIPGRWRMPTTKGMEKWWLREAFRGTGVLPERVRVRMKDAFSDSISGQVSWSQMIQTWVQDHVSEEEMCGAAERFPSPAGAIPQTKEAYYYRRIFCEVFGERRQRVIPGYWQPQWNAEGKEVQGYVDPSARTLGVYETRAVPSL